MHEVPLQLAKGAINATRITRPIFYADTINSDKYVKLTLKEFFAQLTERER
jgi:hypothetical protein